ncbi:MAG: HDOD domain-containing protein [Gammaproteobacteria bacterium]|nr:HDOD domain-containing protein [Gammaproteobacteria bacterium]
MSEDEHFRFVQALAKDLNGQDIKLPSFPDVVIRIRTALDDPDTTGQDLAKVLSNDAVLASRILIFANSTYHNPAGVKIESLDAAVGRIGFEKVRTAAISYAVEQLYASEALAPLKSELRKTWSEGLRLAALSEVIARHCTKLDADSAFIAGLLNRIGVLYIFTKYGEYPSLLQDPESRQSLIDEWAGPIGESIVANWNFSAEIQGTLNPDEVETTRRRTEANLADVVTAAKLSLNGEEFEIQDTDEAKRLQLTDEKMPKILESYQQKLDSLAAAVR